MTVARARFKFSSKLSGRRAKTKRANKFYSIIKWFYSDDKRILPRPRVLPLDSLPFIARSPSIIHRITYYRSCLLRWVSPLQKKDSLGWPLSLSSVGRRVKNKQRRHKKNIFSSRFITVFTFFLFFSVRWFFHPQNDEFFFSFFRFSPERQHEKKTMMEGKAALVEAVEVFSLGVCALGECLRLLFAGFASLDKRDRRELEKLLKAKKGSEINAEYGSRGDLGWRDNDGVKAGFCDSCLSCRGRGSRLWGLRHHNIREKCLFSSSSFPHFMCARCRDAGAGEGSREIICLIPDLFSPHPHRSSGLVYETEISAKPHTTIEIETSGGGKRRKFPRCHHVRQRRKKILLETSTFVAHKPAAKWEKRKSHRSRGGRKSLLRLFASVATWKIE